MKKNPFVARNSQSRTAQKGKEEKESGDNRRTVKVKVKVTGEVPQTGYQPFIRRVNVW